MGSEAKMEKSEFGRPRLKRAANCTLPGAPFEGGWGGTVEAKAEGTWKKELLPPIPSLHMSSRPPGAPIDDSRIGDIFCYYIYIVRIMAKVAMMTEGLRRKPTYEEVIDYIEHDPDKIKYPYREHQSF